MIAFTVLLIIYAAGVILSYFLTKFLIDEYKTADSPYIGAAFSWITIFLVFFVILLEFIMKSEEEYDEKGN